MSRRFYNLPPLNALAAFEAAARNQSFKNAAQELSVTPGAVSHQIKALESDLGAELFLRKHRGVELTREGAALFETLAASFSRISQDLQRIRDQGTGDFVTMGATTAVATLWLSPEVNRFWRQYPAINVNQVIQDRGFRNSSNLDMFIRYGRHDDARMQQIGLYRDRLVPMASPEIAARLTGASLATLAQERLIHLVSEDQSWTSWYDWFRQLGHGGAVAGGIRVNNYSIALHAAQDGAGLALGWERLVMPYLDRGGLVTIAPHALTAPHKFYLVSKPEDELSEAAKALRDWIVDGTRAGSGEFK